VDSNILISALVFMGKEHSLLRGARSGPHDYLVSEHMVEEVKKVIGKKFPKHIGLVDEFLLNAGLIFVPKEEYEKNLNQNANIRDREDRHVLACAVATKCDLIWSGDDDLLALGMYKEITIKSTKQIPRPR